MTETEETPVEETAAPETAEETARKAWDDLQAGASDEESDEPIEEPTAEEDPQEAATEGEDEDAKPEEEEAPKEEGKRRKKRRKVYDMEADPGPPPDWAGPVKEWYQSLPPELKRGAREVARIGHEAYAWRQRQIQETNKARQEVERAKQEVQGLTSVVQRWLPRWGMQGMTPEQAVTKLCTFNEGFIRNPAVAIQEMAKSAGLQITIHNAQSGNPIAQNGNTPTLDPDELLSRVEQRMTERQRQQQVQQQFSTLAQTVTTALRDMQAEETEDGRLCYPDLQSQEFLQRLEPLATAFGKANPHITDWREILRKAYQAADGRVILRRTSQPAKLSNGNIARKAARSIGGSLNGSSDYEAAPGENALETARRVFMQHFSR